MTEASEFDPHFGGSQQAALQALGRPRPFYHWQAILLGRGGDDGYWMRLLGQTNCTHRRVGALIVTPRSIGYGEGVTLRGKPGSLGGNLVTLARGEKRLFADWTWTASAADITSLEIEPAVDSPHGAFAAIALRAGGRVMRFGVDVAHPGVEQCFAAVRELAGASLSAEVPSVRQPRTDGLYVCAANTKAHKIWAMCFRGEHAALLNINNAPDAFKTVSDGSWQVTFRSVMHDAGRYTISQNDPEAPLHIAIPDDTRLLFQFDRWRTGKEGFAPACGEMVFIPGHRLSAGWGTVRTRATCPDWPPQRTAGGELQAADVGAPERAPELREWGADWLQNAMDDAIRGADFRRVIWSSDGHDGTYTRPVGQDAASIRASGASHAAGMGGAGRVAVITDRVIDGAPAACCEAYDLASGESIAVVQHYKKRLLALSLEGQQQVIGPAEPF